MSNQKIAMKPLSVFVCLCIVASAILNLVNLYNGSLSIDAASNLLLFTFGYVALLLILMGIHQSRLLKQDKLYDATTVMQLSRTYKSKMLNE